MITDGTLQARIKKIHASLSDADFNPLDQRPNGPAKGTIELSDLADGKGAFISSWTHPSLTKPTDDAIKAVTL